MSIVCSTFDRVKHHVIIELLPHVVGVVLPRVAYDIHII